jgi:hypothetical protein
MNKKVNGKKSETLGKMWLVLFRAGGENEM